MATRNGPVHVATTSRTYKGKVYQTHLLRRSYREGDKVKHETLGNLSHLPPDLIEVIRARLRGETFAAPGSELEILRSLPHGHVAAVLAVMRQLDIASLVASRGSRERALCLAMVASRVIDARSKLATARALNEETAASSLGLELQVGDVTEDELYQAMDWLLPRQHRIERKLAAKHLHDGSLVLYDVSSSYYTGTHCSLAEFGHDRDGSTGYKQIEYGLLCNSEGCPVAIEVFPGNTGDPKTLGSQIEKVRKRFGLQRVVFVGDRGMITSARIREEFAGVEGLDWITALRADAIKKLAQAGAVDMSLFDEHDLAEVVSPDYPGERLIVCRNPLLADERSRKRTELLAATEKILKRIADATKRERKPLKGAAAIGLRVGKEINRYKVAKHFIIDITDDGLTYRRDEAKIAAEAALDGLYVIRTSVGAERMDAESAVRAYKNLAKVERAFRCLKTVDLKIRPIHHHDADRVRAHVFICMLSYYVEWHMRQKLAPILFEDTDKEEAERLRDSIVSPAQRSPSAELKDLTKRTPDDAPVHSFHSLLQDLGTLAKNRVRLGGPRAVEFYTLTRATDLQRRALDLIGAPSAQ